MNEEEVARALAHQGGGQSLEYGLGFTVASVRVRRSKTIRRLQGLPNVSALPHTKLSVVLARAERLGQVYGVLLEVKLTRERGFRHVRERDSCV